MIEAHPEYHMLLSDPAAIGRDFPIEGEESSAEVNPFLHMGMHISLREQFHSDRPAGIKQLYQKILINMGDPHEAEHAMMECLGESLWQAQNSGQLPDEKAYIHCLERIFNKI